MTKFDKDGFDFGHGSQRYVTYKGEFVARFSYANAAASARHFVKFLIKNFTVEEYFAARATGTSPLPILEAKGYVCYNVERALKRGSAVMVDGRLTLVRREEPVLRLLSEAA